VLVSSLLIDIQSGVAEFAFLYCRASSEGMAPEGELALLYFVVPVAPGRSRLMSLPLATNSKFRWGLARCAVICPLLCMQSAFLQSACGTYHHATSYVPVHFRERLVFASVAGR
jgi:hypothetical protein